MNKAHKKLIIPAAISFLLTSAFCFATLFQRSEAPEAQIQGASQLPTESAAPANTPAPAATLPPDYEIDCDRLRISEVMLLNSAVLPDCSGSFRQYIELKNTSDTPIELEGWSIETDGDKYTFPRRQLEAGEFLLLFLGGDSCDNELHAELSVNGGSRLLLSNRYGCPAQELLCAASTENLALYVQDSGEVKADMLPSPGFENSKDGYAAYISRLQPDSLAISEICPSQGFIELKNLSESNVYLTDYLLSDSADFADAKVLSGAALGAGQGHVFYIGETTLPLSLDKNALYLFDKSGKMLDYVSLAAVPKGGSCGRLDGEQGFFFFAVPSPWQSNFSGKRFISGLPELLIADDGSVSIESDGLVYYTLDGSLPTVNSKLYQAPLTVNAPAVLRCIAVAEDSVASKSISRSFLNDSSELLFSLAVDDYAEFNAVCQRMLQYREMPAELEIVTPEGRMYTACTVSPVPVDGVCAYRLSFAKGTKLGIFDDEPASLLLIPTSGSEAEGSLWINAREFGNCRYVPEY